VTRAWRMAVLAAGRLVGLFRLGRVRATSTVASVLDVPERLCARQAVVVRPDGLAEQWLAFDCPCRERHRLLVNLSEGRRPRWTLVLGRRGAVTLAPSVDSHSADGRCHFWLRDGRVTWARDRSDDIG
jgi:hypothetical protein